MWFCRSIPLLDGGSELFFLTAIRPLCTSFSVFYCTRFSECEGTAEDRGGLKGAFIAEDQIHLVSLSLFTFDADKESQGILMSLSPQAPARVSRCYA